MRMTHFSFSPSQLFVLVLFVTVLLLVVIFLERLDNTKKHKQTAFIGITFYSIVPTDSDDVIIPDIHLNKTQKGGVYKKGSRSPQNKLKYDDNSVRITYTHGQTVTSNLGQIIWHTFYLVTVNI